ncbi:hypothetical protein [uncultured Tateyamaria sp.]|uniref:hypothetical protein n=2 Tax=uncultured Tateyamaria sp. TaxID=455651 RepID=UPI00261920B3|nr:hypothetical protein [uncultured Tateyamaria sp.]
MVIVPMSFHDPNNPRHGRIFELLRQNDAALNTSNTPRVARQDALNPSDVDALKSLALKSLERSDGRGRAAKSGRHDKLL